MLNPRLPEKDDRKRKIINSDKERNVKDYWRQEDVLEMCNKNYGLNSMILKIIDVKPNEQIFTKEKFLVECGKCSFNWITCILWLNSGKKGCPWCKNRCKNIRSYDLYTVDFIGKKIHNNIFDYASYNNDNDIKNPSSNLNLWCGNKDHEFFTETVGNHLSKSERNHSKGCLECLNEKGKEGKDEFHGRRYTKDIFISRSKNIHGEESYDYSNITDETDVSAHSKVPLICKSFIGINDICNHNFLTKVNDHINNKSGCPKCYGSPNYTRASFVEKMEKYYTNNEFSYHLIKDGDIVSKLSKPKISCNNCGYIIENTIISDFLHKPRKRECDNCNNHLPWTVERLKKVCEEKEKEGKYKYNLSDIPNKITGRSKLEIECVSCFKKGYKNCIFNQSIADHLLHNHGCLRCSGNLSWSYERFFDELPSYFVNYFNYDKIDKKGITSPDSIIEIGCKKCKNYFKRKVYKHVKNLSGCRICKKSEAEKITFMYLTERNFEFQDEVKIIGQNGFPCYYDYEVYIGDKTILIELDGQMHFDRVEYFQREEDDFENYKKRDVYKHYMALKEGKKIIRIDYSIPNKDIIKHLEQGLNSESNEYFSTPKIYEVLIESVKNMVIENEGK